MTRLTNKRLRVAVRSVALLGTIIVIGLGLAAWKKATAEESAAAAANQPEPAEVVLVDTAKGREHRGTTTSIGTVLATRSITLRNELPGTVKYVRLTPGQVVRAGALLVALDVAVEEAELKALQARAELAETTYKRLERLAERQAVSAIELDQGRAERDIVHAEIERIRATIARKTIRAPFRARVGIADVHEGQFLDAGTLLTTLQGVDDAVHVDFSVAQSVAAQLRADDVVQVAASNEAPSRPARIVAVDARIDPTTRNAIVRARIDDADDTLTPGASVRVRVPVGEMQEAVMVSVSALRKGPSGDHVFVLETAENGQTRAHLRSVRAGPVLGESVVILGGLQPGERVAASGSFKLREGVLVNVADNAAAGGSR